MVLIYNSESLMDFDEVIENILSDEYLIVEGKVGRWDGEYTIYPLGYYDSLYEAISDVWMRTPDSTLKVYYENNTLKIILSHHDGVNYFEVKALNENGSNLRDLGYDLDEIVHKKNTIKNCTVEGMI